MQKGAFISFFLLFVCLFVLFCFDAVCFFCLTFFFQIHNFHTISLSCFVSDLAITSRVQILKGNACGHTFKYKPGGSVTSRYERLL